MINRIIKEDSDIVNLSTIINGIFIVLIFTVYNIVSSSALLFLGLAVLLVDLILFPSLQFFYLTIFLVSNVMTIKIVGKPNALLGYVTILFCVLLLLKYGLTFKKNVLLKLVAGSLLFILPLLVNGESISFFIRVVSFVITIIVIYNIQNVDEISLLKCYIIGCTVNVISGIIFKVSKGIDIFSEVLAGINDDRNYFSVSCAIALSFLVFMISYTKKLGVFEISNLLILSFGGILSNSRTFIILYAVIIIVFAFEFFRNPTIGIFLVSIIVIWVIGKNTFLADLLGSFDNLMERFNDDNVEGGNGRFESWNVYLSYLFSSLRNAFLGCGNSNKYVSLAGWGTKVVEHNSIVQLLFTEGILGTMGYIVIFSSFSDIVKKQKNFNYSITRILPFVILVVGYCTINGAFSDRFIFSLYVCFCILNLPKLETERKKMGY